MRLASLVLLVAALTSCLSDPPPPVLDLELDAIELADATFHVRGQLVSEGPRPDGCGLGYGGLYGWCDPPKTPVRCTVLSAGCDGDLCSVRDQSGGGDPDFIVTPARSYVTFRVRVKPSAGEHLGEASAETTIGLSSHD